MPHIPIGTRCETSQGLYELLKDWFENSREWTISDGTNATKGYIVVTLGGLTCVMSGDTTRDGVKRYLEVSERGPWTFSVVPDSKGVMCRVGFGESAARIKGFYLYSEE